jgi:hypothetical protein
VACNNLKDDKCLHFHSQAFQVELFDPEDAGTTFSENVMNCLPNDMLSCAEDLQLQQHLKFHKDQSSSGK